MTDTQKIPPKVQDEKKKFRDKPKLGGFIKGKLLDTLKSIKDKSTEEQENELDYYKESINARYRKKDAAEEEKEKELERILSEKIKEMLQKNSITEGIKNNTEKEDFFLAKHPEEQQEVADRSDLGDEMYVKGRVVEMSDCGDVVQLCPIISDALIEEMVVKDEVSRLEEGFYVAGRTQVTRAGMRGIVGRVQTELSRQPMSEEEVKRRIGLMMTVCRPEVAIYPSNKPDLTSAPPPLLQCAFVKSSTSLEEQLSLHKQTHKLELEVAKIKFSKHHLFGNEHAAATLLKSLHQSYVAKKQNKIGDFLKHKEAILRGSLEAKEATMRNAQDADEVQKLKEEAEVLRADLERIEKQRRTELKSMKRLLFQVISTWKLVKEIRKSEQCVSSNVDVKIIRNDVGPTKVVEGEDGNRNEKVVVKKNIEKAIRKTIQEFKPSNKDESQLIVQVTNGGVVTPLDQCPPGEKARRTQLSKCRVVLKVSYNDKVVFKTQPRSIDEDFSVSFQESFTIIATSYPRDVILEVHEDCNGDKRLLGRLVLEAPLGKVPEQVRRLLSYQLEGDFSRKTSINKENLKLPKSLKSFKHFFQDSVINCAHVSCALFCSSDPVQNTLREVQEMGGMEHEVVRQVLRPQQDPNHPANASLSFLTSCMWESEARGDLSRYFRLQHGAEEFQEGGEEENREKLTKEDGIEEKGEDRSACSMIERMRDVSRSTFIKLVSNLLEESAMTKLPLPYNAVVNENALPKMSFSLAFLNTLIQPKRPLRPVRRTKETTTQHLNQPLNLSVSVVRATGLPIKKQQEDKSRRGTQENTTLSTNPWTLLNTLLSSTTRQLDAIHDQCKFYVEVRLRDQRHSTSVCSSNEPTWNENLTFTFTRHRKQLDTDEHIHINLYDFCPFQAQGRSEAQSRWLGGTKVALSSLFVDAKVEGSLRIPLAPLLLGYDKCLDSNFFHLTLSIHLDFKVPFNPIQLHRFKSIEAYQMCTKRALWHEALSLKYPERNFVSMVVTLKHVSTLATRFVHAITPPACLQLDDVKKNSGKILKIAKFVSKLPSSGSNYLQPELFLLWMSSQEFLDMQLGEDKQKGILLCNLLLSLHLPAFLVAGTTAEQGKVLFVLVREEPTEWALWDPCRGERYSCSHTYCPLSNVGSVISPDNIYGNIQASGLSHRMKWDLNLMKHWRPLLETPLPAHHPQDVVYREIEDGDRLELEEKMEKEIMRMTSEMRLAHITRWNRYFNKEVKLLTPLLETNEGLMSEDLKKLEGSMKGYNIFATSLNLSFTSMSDALQSVKDTKFYDVASSEVEFSVAVHIHPYVNNSLSIWIVLATLKRKIS